MDLHSRDLSPTLKDLENKYLISDGLMLNPENKKVLKTLISTINLDYDSLMAEYIFLLEEDLLPGTQTKKISVEQAKLEFDARVKSWYESVDSRPIGTKSLCPVSAPESNRSSLDGDSRCSGRSSRSSLSSFKRKESLVKLKLALFAKEKEKERSRIEQEAERAKQEAERAKQEAERAKQEAERTANEQERALDVELAKFEVKAWDEVLFDRGDRPMPLRRPIAPSSVPICETLRNAEKEAEQTVEKAVARNENCSVEDKKTLTMTNYLATSKSYANVKKFDGMISQYEQPINNSRRSRKIAEPEYEEDRRNVPFPVTHWHAPAKQSASIPILTSQDYPPPRPVIPNFDGDPLTYWPFIRSFEAHIATKISSNSAKLVYLLQHCSPRIRQNLEHLARDSESGYGLAMDSLYNDYGQPHIVAHYCEQKLLAAPRLKTKDPKGLKTLSVLMDKCVAMLRDVQDFATLNSLGTIRRIIEKLPEQTQKDWAKWSYQEFKTTGRQARFEELVRFVQDEAAEANSLYGQVVYGNLKQSLHVGQRRATVLNTTAISDFTPKIGSLTCPFCDGRHELSVCSRF